MIKTLELLAKEEQIDRSELIRRILDVGIQEFLMERALKAYRKREVSLCKAAEMAKVSLRKMIDAADKALIPISYDLESDLAFAKAGKSNQ